MLPECTNYPLSFDQHILSPFVNIGSLNCNLMYHSFENIRTNCKFYDIPASSGVSSLPPSLCPDKLSIIHVNARSLLSDDKFSEFQLFIFRTRCRWSIICISETWLCKDLERKRNLDGYTGYFDNRIESSGGGVAIYVNNDVVRETKQLPKLFHCTQSLTIECQLKNNLSILVCQVYKPPNLSNVDFLLELGNALDELQSRNKITFLCGDFNIDLFNLSNGGASLDFFNTSASSGFLPLISKSTRIQDTCYSLIDNIFCNSLSFVNKSGIILDDTSDHFPIFAFLDFTVVPQRRKIEIQQIFDFHKINDLSSHLEQALQDFEMITDPEIACDKIITAYTSGIDKFSYRYSPNRKNTPIKPWISPCILASISYRCDLFKKRQNNPTEENIRRYVNYRNVLNSLIRNAKQKYIEEQLESYKNDAKKLWDIMNTYTRGKTNETQYPNSFKDMKGKQIESHIDIAESFNEFFSTVGANLQQNMTEHPQDEFLFYGDPCKNTIKHLQIVSSNELINIIQHMKNVGHGVDKINARIFKLTYMGIMKQLVHFINICLTQGKFPRRLKIAIIKPIYKSGDKSNLSNYRPISILPYISKILEKVIQNRIMEHIDHNDILDPNQFGFRQGHSTYMPLLILQDKIIRGFEFNKIHCAIYLDLKKAFDTIDHNILLIKLYKYGIEGTALAMIHSYLSNRNQCVEFRNVQSTFRCIDIGVPQGSILGPLLFILYVNDFPKISSKFTTLLYADDTAILFEAGTAAELQNRLNNELPKVCKWLHLNKLTLNTSKTLFQIYNNSKTNVDINITLNGVNISSAETVRYLGVYIDRKLTWEEHIVNISKIISRNIGIISRSRYFLSCRLRYLLYNALVLPYLNYCCLVWGNTSQVHLNKLIIPQKKIVRILDNQPRLAHTDPIYLKLKILKVKDIAKQQAIMVLYNVATQNAPTSIAALFVHIQPDQRPFRAVKHFQEIFTSKLYRTRTISWVGPRLWNSLVAPRFPNINAISQSSKKHIKEIIRNQLIESYQQMSESIQ